MSTSNAPLFATPAVALVGLLIPTVGLSASPNTPITVELMGVDADYHRSVAAASEIGRRIGSLDVYIDWPETDIPDYAGQHNLARELVTESFLRPEMSNTDGTPFGANALGFDFGDEEPRVYRPGTESGAAPASAVARNRESAPSPDPRILAAHRSVH